MANAFPSNVGHVTHVITVYICLYFHDHQDLDYDGFRQFLDAFLDCETPEELTRHLFISFLKPSVAQAQGKVFTQMAAVSSNAACAAVTSHTKGMRVHNISYVLGVMFCGNACWFVFGCCIHCARFRIRNVHTQTYQQTINE